MTGRIFFHLLDKQKWLLGICSFIYTIYITVNHALKWGGVTLRYSYFKRKFSQCGSNVSIHRNTLIFCPQNISVGNNVSIHPMCYIDGEGHIEIGNNVSIAHSTTIMSANHTWSDISMPIKYCPPKYERVIIEDDVWIGCGVRIMAGVKIGHRCVIAAGAVVTKDCHPNSLYGGVPARFIKAI